MVRVVSIPFRGPVRHRQSVFIAQLHSHSFVKPPRYVAIDPYLDVEVLINLHDMPEEKYILHQAGELPHVA